MSDDELRATGAGHGVEGAEQRVRSAAKDCVHCGFCLPACPTYQLWGEEMDSPRGRIHLVSQLLDGAPLTAATAAHFDRCLGCMACMTACPSGVQYDRSSRRPGSGPRRPEVAWAARLALGCPKPRPRWLPEVPSRRPGGHCPSASPERRSSRSSPTGDGCESRSRRCGWRSERGRTGCSPAAAWSPRSPPPLIRPSGSRRRPAAGCRPGSSRRGWPRAASGVRWSEC